MLNPPVNGKIKGLFKALECLSSTFQGKFHFQGLFKTVLYIQVLFKHVRNPDIHTVNGYASINEPIYQLVMYANQLTEGYTPLTE